MNEGLETLLPQAIVVQAGGETLHISPITVRELPAFISAVEPLLARAASGIAITALLLLNADAVIQTATIGARKPREWIDSLRTDELIDIAEAVATVNADFFVQRLLPKLEAAGERLSAALDGWNSMRASGRQG